MTPDDTHLPSVKMIVRPDLPIYTGEWLSHMLRGRAVQKKGKMNGKVMIPRS
jgi:hypothetical protein